MLCHLSNYHSLCIKLIDYFYKYDIYKLFTFNIYFFTQLYISTFNDLRKVYNIYMFGHLSNCHSLCIKLT